MATDLVLDTHIINEFISQYFEQKVYANGLFIVNGHLTEIRTKRLNKIVLTFRNEGNFSNGIVIMSSIGFVEIARKFKKISNGRYSLIQFKSFLDELPEYVSIAPLEKNLSNHMNKIPKTIMVNSKSENIELPDAIHAATCLSRDSAILLTEDHKIRKIEGLLVL